MFGHAIDEINRGGKRIAPIRLRKGRLMKQGKASFNYVAVTTFRVAVVFRSVGRGGEKGDALGGKKRTHSDVLTAIVRVKSFDSATKEIFYETFEIFESLENVRFVFKGIEPNVFGEVIDKNNIIFVARVRQNRGRPNIRVNNFERGRRGDSGNRKREFMTFINFARITMKRR